MEKIDFWNIIFSIFFLFLMIVGYQIVVDNGGFPTYVGPWDTLILGLAAFRLTRLFVYDSITQWFRDLFEGGQPNTFVGTVGTLVNCAWCTGLWAALVVATVYFAWPSLWFFIYVLALGGVASTLQILANLIGWNAEWKKRATVMPGEKNTGSKCG